MCLGNNVHSYKNVFLSTIRSKQAFITKVYANFYIKRFQKLLLLQDNISKDNRSNNGNNNKKYTRTPAITLSTTRIWAIATSESEITTPSTTKTTTAIVTTMTTMTVFILKSITKTITRVAEMLSTLPMIWVTDHATNEIVIHPDLETLYLWSNLSTHDSFGQTPRYNVFLEYLRI